MPRRTDCQDPIPFVQSWLRNAPACGSQVLAEESLRGLVDRAELEGVGGIVAEELGLDADWLRSRIYGWFISGAKQTAALGLLARNLSESGLEVVALKGAALIPTAYGGRISCRPVSDLDLLVRVEDEEAVRVMSRQIVSGGDAVFDWHRNLLGEERLPSRKNLLQLRIDELWSFTQPWEPGVRHLSPELQFIHLSLHAFKHSCSRLIWLVDQVLVLRVCDFDKLLALARRVGAERPVLVSLHILNRLLKEALPENHLRRLRWHEWLAVWLTSRRGHEVGWGEVFLILSVPGLSNKLKYLYEYLLPAPSVLGEDGRRNRLKASLKRAWRFLWNKNRTRG